MSETGEKILVLGSSSVYVSQDYGNTWTSVSFPYQSGGALTISPNGNLAAYTARSYSQTFIIISYNLIDWLPIQALISSSSPLSATNNMLIYALNRDGFLTTVCLA